MLKLVIAVVFALAFNVGADGTYHIVTAKPTKPVKPVTITLAEDPKPKAKKDKEPKDPVTIVLMDDKADKKAKKEDGVKVEIVADGKPAEKEVEEDVEVEVQEEEKPEVPEPECFSVAAAAAGTPELSTLVAALEAAGLVDTFADPEFVGTVLAPVNDAFDVLIQAFNSTAEQVLSDPQLPNILAYHVIPDAAILSTDLEDGAEVTTLLGQDLVVDTTDGVKFIGAGSEATVIVPDFVACKAVIHVIDTVLLPDFTAIPTN